MELSAQRELMVRTQVASRGVDDVRVLSAMRRVPREAFVDASQRGSAYEDRALPIGCGQTISQPYIVGLMASALSLVGDERVLEVGVGSGYAAAVLSLLSREIFGLERHASLAASASARMSALGYSNVRIGCGDGTCGWAARGPFDAISVAAGGPSAPEALIEQLSPGGRLVIPVGRTRRSQTLVRVRKDHCGGVHRDMLGDVRFVPLIGASGWDCEGSLEG